MPRTFLMLALVVLLTTIPSSQAAQFHLDWPSFEQWLCADSASCLTRALLDKQNFGGFRRSVLQRTHGYVADIVRRIALREAPRDAFADIFEHDASVRQLAQLAMTLRGPRATATELLQDFVAVWRDAYNASYPYFGFLPSYIGAIRAGMPEASLSSDCFASINATAGLTTQSTVNVSLQFSTPASGCNDLLLLMAGGTGDVAIHLANASGTLSFQFSSSADATTQWYLQNQGMHLFKFPSSQLADVIGAIGATLIMMAGEFEYPLSQASADANYEFYRTYTQASPRLQPLITPRPVGAVVGLALEEYIQSGDAFAILRLDGLNPMISWGEGDTAGHTVLAIRNASNVLHVCESTTHDAYWPANGVSCHTYSNWLTLAINAQINVVHLPLSPAARAMFNATAAWNFYNANAGLDYGYDTFLYGWLDLPQDNFPCLPPDFASTCFSRHFFQDVALYVDLLLGEKPTNIFRQALNHRTNTSGLPVLDVLRIGVQQMQIADISGLYTIPEQDSWLYNTTQNGLPAVGKSMTCDVFVCNMWKAGGIFAPIGNNIQCGEQDLWDIFSMKIYDSAKTGSGRPAICQQYDPANPLCQLVGPVYFTFKPDFNTRTLYPNMGEHCSSITPGYIRAAGC